MVSSQDSESSDLGSNLSGTQMGTTFFWEVEA